MDRAVRESRHSLNVPFSLQSPMQLSITVDIHVSLDCQTPPRYSIGFMYDLYSLMSFKSCYKQKVLWGVVSRL